MHDIKEFPAPFDTEVLVFGNLSPRVFGAMRKGCWQPAVLRRDHDPIEECDLESAQWVVTGDIQDGAIMKNVTHWLEMPPAPTNISRVATNAK
jgi:hypothetical protein